MAAPKSFEYLRVIELKIASQREEVLRHDISRLHRLKKLVEGDHAIGPAIGKTIHRRLWSASLGSAVVLLVDVRLTCGRMIRAAGLLRLDRFVRR